VYVSVCVYMGMLSGAVSGMGRPVVTFVLFTFVKEGRRSMYPSLFYIIQRIWNAQ